MDSIERAYVSGMEGVFASRGLNKTAAHNTAKAITALSKKASMFGLGDSPYGGMSLSSILIPLLAASAVGYVGYNAGLGGNRNRSAFDNVKNYIGGKLNKLVRNQKAPSLFNFA